MNDQDFHNPDFEELLDFLRSGRGFDFSGYKRSSLIRRVDKRRHALALSNYGEYMDYLQVHPDEFEQLFNTILINVTSFFRDKTAWDHLRDDILPHLLNIKSTSEPFRVWSAGCASGEEAYSLAMILAEHLGVEAFHERVKIYATDIDLRALAQARLATYTADDIKDIPEDLREKYFARAGGGAYVFNPDLRRAVIFGEHDLMQDAPISRLDLLVCRNTLMYFNSEAQGRILSRFHFALNDGCVLFLGKAEMLLTHSNLFAALDMKYRFFTRISRPDMRDHLLSMGNLNTDEQLSNRLERLMRIRDLAFDTSPDAQLIIDNSGILLAANSQARRLFNLAPRDIGGMLQEMEVCYQPINLRPLIDRVVAEKRSITIPDVETHTAPGDSAFLTVSVIPLQDSGEQLVGVIVLYVDISHTRALEEQLKGSSLALETTNEELQATNEELETTNEELQSTVEELETTNEELQSTNEELETMNEELQSTNEELETMNDELNLRTTDLNLSMSFLETILGNLKVGVVVVDSDFRIQNWNAEASNMWGMRSDEVIGKSLLGLDIGLPVEMLKQPIRTVLDKHSKIEELALSARNRRGQTIKCQVTLTPFADGSNLHQGVVLMMEPQPQEG